jgi:hypothetical protein
MVGMHLQEVISQDTRHVVCACQVDIFVSLGFQVFTYRIVLA